MLRMIVRGNLNFICKNLLFIAFFLVTRNLWICWIWLTLWMVMRGVSPNFFYHSLPLLYICSPIDVDNDEDVYLFTQISEAPWRARKLSEFHSSYCYYQFINYPFIHKAMECP